MTGNRINQSEQAELSEELWKDPDFYQTQLPRVLVEFSVDF